MLAMPGLSSFHGHIDRVNRDNSYDARREYDKDLAAARERVARFVGAKPTEIAFTGGATEALQPPHDPVQAGGARVTR